MLDCNFHVDTGFVASGARMNNLFLDVMTCSLVGSFRSLGGDDSLHLQGRIMTFLSLRWNLQTSANWCYLYTKL